MEICSIKLATGTEIVATIHESLISSEDPKDLWYNQKVIVLQNPIVVVPNQEGQLGAMPVSFSGVAKQITMSVHHILTIMETEAQIKERYVSEENDSLEDDEMEQNEKSPLAM